MASFYPNLPSSPGEGDHHRPAYLLNHKHPSYPSNLLSVVPPNEINARLVVADTSLLHNQLIQSNGLSLTLGSQDPSSLNPSTYLSFDHADRTFTSSDFGGILCSSKYMKAAQGLLDELVTVHRALKKPHNFRHDTSSETNPASCELQGSVNYNDLQNTVTKLLAMLDEVDRRYKLYCHQMQMVVSSFDMVAGEGAARPYTSLALQTISRQFHSLRDAIKKQVQTLQKILGEQDVDLNGIGVLSRLRHVDQQIRQQKALHQFGVMRQTWRPQRGLPESAVSVLRAWLFEHFLHPYPKDSEKVVLARQTGLTRSQVANWFINARVRLWKPMIEEMYKEEFGDVETEPKSPPENVTETTFEDRDDEFQGHIMSPASVDNKIVNNVTMTDQVSLALGLQNHDDRDLKTVVMPDGSSSTVGIIDKLDYYYMVDPVNNQHRFGNNNNHLLSDFVS